MTWAIRHLDLQDGPRRLPAPDDGRGLYVVFWWGDLPLGDWYVHAEELPVPRAQVAETASRVVANGVGARLLGSGFQFGPEADPSALDLDALRHLRAPLRQLGTERGAPDLSVTVAICTRDRPGPLARCLASLGRLRAAPREILVVDNAPTSEATREVADRHGARYVREPRPGLDIARNTALRHAAGDVIAFVDDDVEVHPAWLAPILEGFGDPSVGAVTGLILPLALDTPAQTAFERHWTFNKGFLPRTFRPELLGRRPSRAVPVWDVGAGANMAVRRAAVEAVGPFDERLDAGAAGCSGDSELWFRLLAGGWSCAYVPDAVVFHAHRAGDDELLAQVEAYMRGHVASLLVQYDATRRWGELRRVLLTLPRWYLRLGARRLRHGADDRTRTLGAEVWGALGGVGYFLRHRRTPPVAAQPPAS